MKILHELHKLGYQKFRWMSYMASTGLSLRCHITTQDHIVVNQEIILMGIRVKCGVLQSVKQIIGSKLTIATCNHFGGRLIISLLKKTLDNLIMMSLAIIYQAHMI